jgi:alcohol dehydrogenase (cytochrome c)
MWMTGTYDPDFESCLRWHRQSHAGFEWPDAAGPDNQWTCSIVAINPDTGKMAWGFQVSPHDTHDWDAAEVRSLSMANSTANNARW